jgi:hypothetical protein
MVSKKCIPQRNCSPWNWTNLALALLAMEESVRHAPRGLTDYNL